MPLYALTIAASAFLLFLVEPLIARQILPWFGGSAAVWSTCLVFFQVMLPIGYAYADWSTRRLRRSQQVLLHLGLLLASLPTMPILANPDWQPNGGEQPAMRILGLLFATIGLPFFLLSTTGPLLQAWCARDIATVKVYRLFALSNAASLLALVAYPFVVEPQLTTAAQAHAWSAGYAVFVLLCGLSALYHVRQQQRRPQAEELAVLAAAVPLPGRGERWLWLLLPLLGTWLLLAITNHIQQNIAAIPFLWLLPLSLYLLSFILCFAQIEWYRRVVFLPLLAGLLLAAAYFLQSSELTLDLWLSIPLYLGVLFAGCMFCHGELARRRPAPTHLTTFYLYTAVGGAIGGLLVGVAAPLTLDFVYELGAGLVLTAMLTAVVLRATSRLLSIAALLIAGAAGYGLYCQVQKERGEHLASARNFYGTLCVKDYPFGLDTHLRRLIHGVIKHGEQIFAPDHRDEITSYYGHTSGVGLAMDSAPANKRVGVIGLGVGTLAAYGQPGDVFRFYDINPQVIDFARRHFTFLADSKAVIEIALGDARLSLAREADQHFDLLVVDAFSSDAIPVHLLTEQALAIYLRHLQPDGVIAYHVTNRFLDLAPVVGQLAERHGLDAAWIADATNGLSVSSTDWVLVSPNHARLQIASIVAATTHIRRIEGLRPWTEDHHSLLQILK